MSPRSGCLSLYYENVLFFDALNKDDKKTTEFHEFTTKLVCSQDSEDYK